MTPVIITKIAQGGKKVLENKNVQLVLVLLIVWFILRGGIRKALEAYRQSKFNKNETKDPNLLAQQYGAATNPSGYKFMRNIDGTDEIAIDRLAYQTKGILKQVSQAYKLKFNESLTDRLRRELSAKDFQSWRNIVT